MLYAVGVVAFALALVASVCLHEAGHMLTAKAFGMSVPRYFVGFGRTVFSFRRGETEYGLKAIPAGGFVTIVGMNPADLEDGGVAASQGRAFWQFAVWKRSIVLAAGSVTHVLLAVVLMYVALVGFGKPTVVPNDRLSPTLGSVAACALDSDAHGGQRACTSGDPASPAQAAGLRKGDTITSVDGRQIASYAELQRALAASPVDRPITIGYQRDGRKAETQVTLVARQRPVPNAPAGSPTRATPTLGVTGKQVVENVRLGPVAGVRETGSFIGQMVTGSVSALGTLPSRIPHLFQALSGAERSPEDPISVVGASRIGGDVASSQGASGIAFILSLLASFNVFLGLFNLLPLPPLDGGHLAITWFERVRSALAARAGRPEPGMVDRNRLIPLTLAVIVVFGAFTLLTVSADIVNPIRFG